MATGSTALNPPKTTDKKLGLGRANSGSRNSGVLHQINASIHGTQRQYWKDYDRSTIYSSRADLDQMNDDFDNKSGCSKCLWHLRYSIRNNNYKLLFLFLRSIKLIRLIKMARYVKHFKKSYITDRELKITFELFKLVCQALLFSHFAACCWWFVGQRTEPSWIDATEYYIGDDFDDSHPLRELGKTSDNNVIKYSYSYYWAVVTLFTTGYGDITPKNIYEQWVAVVCILMGTIFFSYFIGTLTALITEGDKVRLYKEDRLEEAQFFCDQKRLPQSLSRAVITHTRYHCDYNYVFDESELLYSLPPQLQDEIQAYLGKNILHQIDFFQGIDDCVLGEISLRMRSISCNEGYDLFKKNDRGKHIYIQRTGTSILNSKKNNKFLLKRGHVCGELALIYPKRKKTVTCQTWSEFYVLAVTDIIYVLQSEYPWTWKEKFKKIQKIAGDSTIKRQRKVQFNQSGRRSSDLFGLNEFLNADSTIQTKRFGGVSSLRTGYDGQVSTNYSRDMSKELDNSKEKDAGFNLKPSNSIFGSLRGILNKKDNNIVLKSPDIQSTIHGSGDDLIDGYDEIILQDTMKRQKSVLPSFLKKRRDSLHRDQAVSNAYLKRNNSYGGGLISMEALSIVDENGDMDELKQSAGNISIDLNAKGINDIYGSPQTTPSSTELSDNDRRDVVGPDFSVQSSHRPEPIIKQQSRNKVTNISTSIKKRYTKEEEDLSPFLAGLEAHKQKRVQNVDRNSHKKKKKITKSKSVNDVGSMSPNNKSPPISPIVSPIIEEMDFRRDENDDPQQTDMKSNTNTSTSTLSGNKSNDEAFSIQNTHTEMSNTNLPKFGHKSNSKSKSKSKRSRTKSKSINKHNKEHGLSNLGTNKRSKSNLLNTPNDIVVDYPSDDDEDILEIPTFASSPHSSNHTNTSLSRNKRFGKSHSRTSLRSNPSQSRSALRYNQNTAKAHLHLETVVSGHTYDPNANSGSGDDDNDTDYNPTPHPTDNVSENIYDEHKTDTHLKGFSVSKEYNDLKYEPETDALMELPLHEVNELNETDDNLEKNASYDEDVVKLNEKYSKTSTHNMSNPNSNNILNMNNNAGNSNTKTQTMDDTVSMSMGFLNNVVDMIDTPSTRL